MSQMDSDGVEDVVNGQGRLLAGAAGTAMAAAARLIAERTRRQREAAATQLASDQARAEADRRLLLVRLEMAKTDQWREQAPLGQVAETLYLARLHERTEPSAAAAIPGLEDHVRTRFDRDPKELVTERIRQVADQREAEAVYALDAVERAQGVTGAANGQDRAAALGREQERGQQAPAVQELSAVSGAQNATASTTASMTTAAAPATTPAGPTGVATAAGNLAGRATRGVTAGPCADTGRRARVRPPAAGSGTATTTTAAAAASWTRSSARPAAPTQGVEQTASPATARRGLTAADAAASTASAPEPEVASGEDLSQRMLARHRAAHARSHAQNLSHDHALEYGQ